MTEDATTEQPLSEQDPGSEEDRSREEEIRRRAYDISVSGDAGTPEENWERAEREIDGAS